MSGAKHGCAGSPATRQQPAFTLHPFLKAAGTRLRLRSFTLGTAGEKVIYLSEGKSLSLTHVLTNLLLITLGTGSPWQSGALLF